MGDLLDNCAQGCHRVQPPNDSGDSVEHLDPLEIIVHCLDMCDVKMLGDGSFFDKESDKVISQEQMLEKLINKR